VKLNASFVGETIRYLWKLFADYTMSSLAIRDSRLAASTPKPIFKRQKQFFLIKLTTP